MSDEARAALVRAIEAHGGLIVEQPDEDRLKVELGGHYFTLNLDNLRRRVGMGDSLDSIVSDFLTPLISAMPEVEGAARLDGLRLMLEQTSVVEGTETLVQAVSKEVAIIVVWTDPQESRIRFIRSPDLRSWQLEHDPVWAAARSNMNRLIAATPLTLMDAKGLTLGMLETQSVFKASLLAAPSLREHVADKLGWPVLAVAPCRDFVYLIPHSARDQLGRMGTVVKREFTHSAYPLSPEVFQVNDEGIRSVGRFQVEAE